MDLCRGKHIYAACNTYDLIRKSVRSSSNLPVNSGLTVTL